MANHRRTVADGMSFERFVGRRYMHPHGRTVSVSIISWISLFGVTIAVMVLMVVLSVMNGFQSDLIEKAIGAYSHIILDTSYLPGSFEPAHEILMKIDNVEGASPVVIGQTLIRSRAYGFGAQVKGVDPRYESEVTGIEEDLVCGSLDPLAEENRLARENRGAGTATVEELFAEDRNLPGIVLGKELAKKLFANLLPPRETWSREAEKEFLPTLLGVEMNVLSPYEEETPMGGSRFRQRKFRLVGITDSGLFDYDDISGFVSLDSAGYLYDLSGVGYRRIEIKVNDPEAAEATMRECQQALFSELRLSFGGMTWKDFNRPLFTAIEIEKRVMFVILAMLILLAGFSVAATLILTVMEKTREIGTLRALGASRTQVRNLFLRIGLVVGGIGSGVGGILGGAVCLLLKVFPIDLPGGGGVYYIEKMPVEPQLVDFAAIVGVTLVVCVLASAYPARIAARLVPVEALRYE